MNPSSESPSSAKASPARSPLLFIVLGVAIVAYLVTLPWQQKQWEQAKKLKEESALQEAHLHDVQAQHAAANAAETRLRSAAPGDVATRLDAVRAYLSHGDTTSAGKLLEAIEEETFGNTAPPSPPSAEFASTLAGLFQEAGWVDHALANARRAVDRTPNDVGSLLRLAVIEAQIGWQTECRQHIAAARKLAPNSAEPHLALALLDNQVGADEEAERELLAADQIRPNDEHITLLLFQNQMDRHLYDRALATAEKVLQAHPASPALLYARSQALIEKALNHPGGADKAGLQTGMEAAQRYAKAAPEAADAHFLIGQALQGLGDETGALKEWETLYAAQPRRPGLAIKLGRILLRHGDKERGKALIAQAEQGRKEADDYNRLLTTAGMMRKDANKQRELARWCEQQGRLSLAIIAWEQVLALVPGDSEASRERQACLQQREQGPKSPAA